MVPRVTASMAPWTSPGGLTVPSVTVPSPGTMSRATMMAAGALISDADSRWPRGSGTTPFRKLA